MRHMMNLKKFTTALILPLIWLTLSCAGTDPKTPGNARTFTGSSKTMSRAAKSIDGFITREIFFTLSEKVDCITIQATAEYTPYRFAEEKKIARTFFIIERLIDLSPYGKKNADVFTELKRNFSDRWGRQRSVSLCNSPRLPLQRIDSKSVYRMRITTFIKGDFEYRVTLFSDTPVRFFNTLQEALTSIEKQPEIKK